jgi:hypothetical protein
MDNNYECFELDPNEERVTELHDWYWLNLKRKDLTDSCKLLMSWLFLVEINLPEYMTAVPFSLWKVTRALGWNKQKCLKHMRELSDKNVAMAWYTSEEREELEVSLLAQCRIQKLIE